MGTHLRLYDSAKTALGILPDHTGLTTQVALNAPGTLVCDYPLNGAHADLLDQDVAYLAVVVNGVESPDWFLLDDDGDDEQNEAGDARPLRIGARGLLALLEHAQVYPKAHAPGASVNGMDPHHAFVASTPGTIVKTLIDRAKARGCFPDLTYDFTATVDSAGTPWPKTYDVTYDAGLNYLTVVQAMSDNGQADVRMSGFTLQLYVPETELGKDLTGSVLLRLGQQVLEAPRKRSRRGIISHLLGIGDGTNMVEVSDATTQSKYGRREGNATDGRMTTNGSLTDLANETLKQHTDAKEGFTLQLALDAPPGETWPVPGVDYSVGHKIAYDQRRLADGSFEALRVRTLTWAWGSPTEPPTCSIEVNDLFVEANIRLQRRVTGIVNGSVIDGSPVVDMPKDTTTPKAPTGLVATPFTYFEGKANRSGATLTWTAVARNTDESDYTDHSAYKPQYRLDGGTWRDLPGTQEPTAFVDNLPPLAMFEFRVCAVDTSGHVSAYTTLAAAVQLPQDQGPPAQPSVLTASSRLGTVTLTWDGLDFEGAAQALDFDHLRVYRSTDPGSRAPAGEFMDRLYGPGGTIVLSDLPYNVTQYFTAVAVDRVGNESPSSDPVAAVTTPLVDTDLIGKVIDGAANIIAETVPSEALAPRAVTTEKLTVGAIGDELVLNGSFEDVSSDDPTLPATWQPSVSFPGPAAGINFETAAPLSGGRSVRLAVTLYGQPSQSACLESTDFPVVEGEKYALRVTARDDTGTSPGFHYGLIGGPAVGGTTRVWGQTNLTVPATATSYSSNVTIPAGWKYARVILLNYSDTSTAAHTVTVDGASCRRVIVSAQLADGAITTPKLAALAVQAGNIAANAVQADKIDVGAVQTQHIKLGTFNKNLVPDPSFEEDYAIVAKAGAPYGQWRVNKSSGTYSVSRVAAPRSGSKALQIYCATSSFVQVVSGVFDVTPGKTYVASVNAGKLDATQGSRLYLRIAAGSTQDLTEYTADSLALALPFDGEDGAAFAENRNVTYLGSPTIPDLYDNFTGQFTVPAGIKKAAVLLYSYLPSGASTVVVDDVSVVELGVGATELTSAGLRLFGTDGMESGAFVSNRPNTLSVASNGATLAAIDSEGGISGQALQIAGRDTDGDGIPDQGASIYGKDFSDWIWGLPWGVVAGAYSSDVFGGSVYTEYGIGEVSFTQVGGREYKVTFGGMVVWPGAATTRAVIRLRYTSDGTAPKVGTSQIGASCFKTYTTTYPELMAEGLTMKGNFGPPGSTIRVMVTLEGLNALNVAYDCRYAGGVNHPFRLFVEDIGPEVPDTFIAQNGGGVYGPPGGTASAPLASKQNYVYTFKSTAAATYKGSGTKRTDTTDVVQGYNSYNGDGEGLWVFPAMTSYLSGATINKIEVYAYANTWWSFAGGTALIKVHGYASAPASNPSMTTAASSANWARGAGRWVTLPSSLYAGFKAGTYKGFGMGPAGSTSGTFYGRFRGSGAYIRCSVTK